jgi:hypothetical protein
VKTNLQVLHGTLAVYPTMIQQFGHREHRVVHRLLPTPGGALCLGDEARGAGLLHGPARRGALFGVVTSCPGFVRTSHGELASILSGQPGRADRKGKAGAAAFARSSSERPARTAIIVPHTDIRFAWRLYRASPWLYARVVLPVVMRKVHPERKSGIEAVYVRSVSWLFRMVGSVVGRG